MKNLKLTLLLMTAICYSQSAAQILIDYVSFDKPDYCDLKMKEAKEMVGKRVKIYAVSYTHLRAHETR